MKSKISSSWRGWPETLLPVEVGADEGKVGDGFLTPFGLGQRWKKLSSANFSQLRCLQNANSKQQGKRSSHQPPKHGIKLSNRTTHTHKSNCQIASPAHPQICHLCVLDHYNSTHTIIRVAVKKRHQLTPRFGTSVCWIPIAAFKPLLE